MGRAGRTGRKRLLVFVLGSSLIAGACAVGPAGPQGSTPPGSGPTPSELPSSTGPSASSSGVLDAVGVLPSLPPGTEETMLAAAEAELEIRRRIREDAGIAESLGPSDPRRE